MFILSLTSAKVSISFDICKFLSNFFQKIFNTVGTASTPGRLPPPQRYKKNLKPPRDLVIILKKNLTSACFVGVTNKGAIEAVRA
jgi:hypothetical protein